MRQMLTKEKGLTFDSLVVTTLAGSQLMYLCVQAGAGCPRDTGLPPLKLNLQLAT